MQKEELVALLIDFLNEKGNLTQELSNKMFHIKQEDMEGFISNILK